MGFQKIIYKCLLAFLAATGSQQAMAVFTYSGFAVTQRQINLRIGSTGSTIDKVNFAVPGAQVGTGPVAASTGGILVVIDIRKPITPSPAQPQSLTVNSSTPLTCVAGSGCGSTTIPMTSISWVSTVLETGTYLGWDVPSGTFDSTANQVLFSKAVNPAYQGSMTITNTLVFTYANTAIYPAGNYSGRVVFTASAL